MMAALRLENVAHQAVSAPFVLRVAQVKSPENGHLAGVGGHGLDEAPDEHEEEEDVEPVTSGGSEKTNSLLIRGLFPHLRRDTTRTAWPSGALEGTVELTEVRHSDSGLGASAIFIWTMLGTIVL